LGLVKHRKTNQAFDCDKNFFCLGFKQLLRSLPWYLFINLSWYEIVNSSTSYIHSLLLNNQCPFVWRLCCFLFRYLFWIQQSTLFNSCFEKLCSLVGIWTSTSAFSFFKISGDISFFGLFYCPSVTFNKAQGYIDKKCFIYIVGFLKLSFAFLRWRGIW
jgi:hypothetical protein